MKGKAMISTHLCGSISAPPNDPRRCPHLLYAAKAGEAYNVGGKRKKELTPYYVYCTAEGRCRSLGCVSSWTGNSPSWCPKRRTMAEQK